MAVIRVLGSRVIVRRPPPWAKHADYVLASGPFNNNSPGQDLAKAQLIDAAASAFGSTGFVGGLPVVAARVRQATAGHTTGRAKDPNAERMARHQAAAGTAAMFRNRAAGRAGGGAARAGAGYEMF